MDVIDMYLDYDHIGNEFLTWMWFKGETDQTFQFAVGNKIVFSKEKETVTIKGEESELIIGKVAMSDGYVVSEMQVIYSSDDPRFLFTMKGSDLSFSGLKVPKVEGDGSDNEEEGMILEKVSLVEEITSVIDKVFKQFILERVDSSGWEVTVQEIKGWINEG
jgi:hypothetical protein